MTYEALREHLDAQTDDNHACGGHRSATAWVKTKDAWIEPIPHEEEGHWECACGAIK